MSHTRQVRRIGDSEIEHAFLTDIDPCCTCREAVHCRHELIACKQFFSFVRFGGKRWTTEKCVPSAAIFAKIFGGDDA